MSNHYVPMLRWRAHLLTACFSLSAACATTGPQLPVPRPPAQAQAAADTAPHQFYHRLPYGSEAQFNPLTQILNEGFDMLRMDGADRRVVLRARYYGDGFENIARSFLRPDRTYGRYGWGRALRNEILPLTFGKADGGGAWVPNYSFHLVGSGMVSARMTEWFEQHGASHATALSFLTMTASHLMNEAVGTKRRASITRRTLSPICSSSIPPGSCSSAQPRCAGSSARRCSSPTGRAKPRGPFRARRWKTRRRSMCCVGPLPWTDRWRLLYGCGAEMLVGVSRDLPDGYSLSVAAGGDAVHVRLLDASTGTKTVDMRPVGGSSSARCWPRCGTWPGGRSMSTAATPLWRSTSIPACCGCPQSVHRDFSCRCCGRVVCA